MTCNVCHTAILGDHISVAGAYFHDECFASPSEVSSPAAAGSISVSISPIQPDIVSFEADISTSGQVLTQGLMEQASEAYRRRQEQEPDLHAMQYRAPHSFGYWSNEPQGLHVPFSTSPLQEPRSMFMDIVRATVCAYSRGLGTRFDVKPEFRILISPARAQLPIFAGFHEDSIVLREDVPVRYAVQVPRNMGQTYQTLRHIFTIAYGIPQGGTWSYRQNCLLDLGVCLMDMKLESERQYDPTIYALDDTHYIVVEGVLPRGVPLWKEPELRRRLVMKASEPKERDVDFSFTGGRQSA